MNQGRAGLYLAVIQTKSLIEWGVFKKSSGKWVLRKNNVWISNLFVQKQTFYNSGYHELLKSPHMYIYTHMHKYSMEWERKSEIKRTEVFYLCPRISDWSHTPPSAILWNSRPRVLATDLPTLVLPTPGGPTKQRIGPFRLFFSCLTAKYSSTLFFSFSMA